MTKALKWYLVAKPAKGLDRQPVGAGHADEDDGRTGIPGATRTGHHKGFLKTDRCARGRRLAAYPIPARHLIELQARHDGGGRRSLDLRRLALDRSRRFGLTTWVCDRVLRRQFERSTSTGSMNIATYTHNEIAIPSGAQWVNVTTNVWRSVTNPAQGFRRQKNAQRVQK